MKWWQSYFAWFSLKFRGLKMLKAARACGQIIARRNERRAQCELENKPTPLLCMCERAGARASAPPVKFFDSPLWRLRSPFCTHLLSPFDHRGSTRVFLTKRKLPCWEIKEKSVTTTLQRSPQIVFHYFTCDSNNSINKHLQKMGNSRNIKIKQRFTIIEFKSPGFPLPGHSFN